MAPARDQFGLRSMLMAVAGVALVCAPASWWVAHVRAVEVEQHGLPADAAYASLFFGLGTGCVIFAFGVVVPVCLVLAWRLSQRAHRRRRG
jgi:hypothetical protein